MLTVSIYKFLLFIFYVFIYTIFGVILIYGVSGYLYPDKFHTKLKKKHNMAVYGCAYL